MKNQLKHIITFLLSTAICIGMLYALYIDLNYFLTRKEATAEVLKVSEVKYRKPFRLQLLYYNEFQSNTIECNINLDAHDTNMLIEKFKQNKKIDVLYAKNYPTKIYVKGINTPRLLIVVVEVFMIVLMLFTVYSCVKTFIRNQ